MKSRELKVSEMCVATCILTRFCMFRTSHNVEKMPRRRFNPDQPGNVQLRFMFFPAVIECITWQMKSRELKLSELRMATRFPTGFRMCGTSHGVEKTVEGGTSPCLYNANES